MNTDELIKKRKEITLDEYLELNGFNIHPKLNSRGSEHDWGELKDYEYIDSYYRTMDHYQSYISELMKELKKIQIIDGNLLDFPEDINFIAHSCNTHNVMGAGIARQIKDRYPSSFEVDCKAMYENDNQLGWYSFAWTDATQSKGIYNMYTQNSIGKGREVNYEGFYNALCNVADHIEWQDKHDSTTSSLGLPWGISCGLAGGSWGIIFAIINEILVDRKFKTYIVKYNE